MMEQREKLIELIKDITARPTTLENDVNYLIANGVVVLPHNASVIEWHEVKTRLLDDEEKEYYSEIDMEPEYIFDCEMNEDDVCKCVIVPLRTPCDYFVERDNF